MNILAINANKITRPDFPVKPIITTRLKQELHQLTNSLRAQVRNVIAVNNWLQQKSKAAGTSQNVPVWPHHPGEVLSFRLVSSPEAFKLFTDTLLRKSFFLHYYGEVNPEEQVLKTRIRIGRMAEWEQELSIIFESINISVYLDTLLYRQQPAELFKRKAS